MNVFETTKADVTLRQAAEHYGLRIPPSGMICCPFHEDRHPSLKLNGDYFFCFGCGAAGDVIDFTARLLGLSCYEAAQKLASDFGISAEPGQVTTGASKSKPPQWHQSRLDELRFLAHASVEERDSTIAALLADGSIASWENCLAEDRKGERHRAKEAEIA